MGVPKMKITFILLSTLFYYVVSYSHLLPCTIKGLLESFISTQKLNQVVFIVPEDKSNEFRRNIVNTIIKTEPFQEIFFSITSTINEITTSKRVLLLFLECNMAKLTWNKDLFLKENLHWLVFTPVDVNNESLVRIPLNINTNFIVAKFSNESFVNLEEIQASNTHLNDSTFGSNNTEEFCKHVRLCLVQVYRVRSYEKLSIVRNVLGCWNTRNATYNLNLYKPVKKRNDFNNFPLIYGQRINSTEYFSNEINPEDEQSGIDLNEFVDYFTTFLNSGKVMKYYERLGTKEERGIWTGLLKAVVQEDVDVAIQNIIQTSERHQDMSFTNKIMTSVKNIYVKPKASNELRDIFLAPLGKKILACFIATGTALGLGIYLLNHIFYKQCKDDPTNHKHTVGDGFICSLSIICMQGSIWKPYSCSENVLIITSLAFALVIYSSYSAFITSILPVELQNIRSVKDLLESDYKIGYVKTGQDELYLRTMKEKELQHIYVRGFLQSNITNLYDGLLLSTKGEFGLFASRNTARRVLQKINRYKCISNITEIPIYTTHDIIAFPMSKTSPYRKLINIAILKMYETGIHSHIQAYLEPELVKCTDRRIFKSALLADLFTAFAILIIGAFGSIIIFVFEWLWFRKTKISSSIHNFHLPHLHFHHARMSRNTQTEIVG